MPKVFKDNEGREWTISVNVATIKRVRSLLNVNLIADDLKKVIGDILGDPVLLVDLLYVVCKQQADERNLPSEAFGAAMYGDCIHAATVAFLEELTDFTPYPRDRVRLRRVIQEINNTIVKAADYLDKMLEAELPKMQNEVEQRLRTLSKSSTNSLDKSESTPTP